MLRVRGYEVWGRLGEGGMSEVWLAKHTPLRVPVVVKTLRGAAPGDDATARVLREAQLMARVRSARVVRATDAGTTEDGVPFLVQEYVDGLDLAELDARRRRATGRGLPLWFVCHAMGQLGLGLRAAHHAGVVHRDVKPSNAFLSPEQGIQLGDFGIARVAAHGAPEERSGTLRFMAPEQLRGEPSGRRTDVFGAGATACDLFYGEPPFPSLEATLAPDVEPRLPAPRTPPEAYFQAILRQMLAKDPERRLADLGEPVHHFDVLSRMLAPRREGGQWLAPNRVLFSGVEIVFAVGDLADSPADLLVGSSTCAMTMRSGVGDALRRRAGDALEDAAVRDGEQPLGSCLVTGGFGLAARHVVHAVSGWNEVSCVGRAFARALLVAGELRAAEVAAPALGTGQGRVSLEMCAKAMLETTKSLVLLGGMPIRRLVVVLDSEAKRRTFVELAHEVLVATGSAAAFDDGLLADGLAPDGGGTSPDLGHLAHTQDGGAAAASSAAGRRLSGGG